MLSTLTSYLVQHKKVYIPYIGTFELLYKPAVLDFADRLIHPPSREVVFVPEGSASKEQVDYLGSALQLDEDSIEAQLQGFGQYLRQRIQKASFSWKGFGELVFVDGIIAFQPLAVGILRPVAAHKIIREGAHHDVLVGEKEMHSSDVSYINDNAKSGRSYAVLIGWILVLIAAAFIVYYLYEHGFHPFASGLQQRTFSFNAGDKFQNPSFIVTSLALIL